jgi:hypothetical protein
MTFALKLGPVKETSFARGECAFGSPGTAMSKLAGLHRVRSACNSSWARLAVDVSSIPIQSGFGKFKLFMQMVTILLFALVTSTFKMKTGAGMLSELPLQLLDSAKLGYD